jgi:hypothetical protein
VIGESGAVLHRKVGYTRDDIGVSDAALNWANDVIRRTLSPAPEA